MRALDPAARPHDRGSLSRSTAIAIHERHQREIIAEIANDERPETLPVARVPPNVLPRAALQKPAETGRILATTRQLGRASVIASHDSGLSSARLERAASQRT